MTTRYTTLNYITGKLNGAGKHNAGNLNGMFFRREDFESSTKQVTGHLHRERVLALEFVKKGYGENDFSSAAEKASIRPYARTKGSTGDSSFTTYDLSPALRHFINDYCRILEPLVKLLAQKHPTISAAIVRQGTTYNMSFNSYLKLLNGRGITTPLDYDYFINLYNELWNDYKHAESAGVQASGWSSNGNEVTSEPKLSSKKLVHFKDMLVKDFIDTSLNNMKALLDYIA